MMIADKDIFYDPYDYDEDPCAPHASHLQERKEAQHGMKIAVFRALQLGDLLCAIPAIRALRNYYPGAEISLIGLPWAASLPQRFPNYIDRFIHFPGYPGLPEQEYKPADVANFMMRMQQERFDLILQMQGNGTLVNPMIELWGSHYSAGFYTPGHYFPNNSLFLQYPEGIHEIERHLALMKHLGIEACGNELEFPLYPKDMEDVEKLGLQIGYKNYVCVHPGSRGAWRQWPVAHFAQLANTCSEMGLAIVLTGTKDELPLVKKVARLMKVRPIIAAGKTSLGAVAVLIKHAYALIANCTGVSHIASAFKTPSVIISMDGEPERWAPIDQQTHFTIDWTRDKNFNSVQRGLLRLLDTFPLPGARAEAEAKMVRT